MKPQFQKVVLGGTFDLLHLGHQELLLAAFKLGKFVSIGLTTDHFNQKRHKKTYQNYPTRKKALQQFLKQQNLTNLFKIAPINDIYGNSHTDPLLEAIIITPETEPSALLINKKRLKNKLNELKIITIPHLVDDSNQIISSTRIRNGQIDQTGLVYLNFLLKRADKPLSDQTKKNLKEPLGTLMTNPPRKKTRTLISVGDITTQQFLKSGIMPDLSIIDLKTNRLPTFNNLHELGFSPGTTTLKVSNPAGQITAELIQALEKNLSSSSLAVLEIDGEEELAVLPAVLLSPLGTKIYYGQPGSGIVQIIVNPVSKQKIWQILN